MKELQEILKRIDKLAPDEGAVLATVVDVKGSSYRLPGAKMLILENGESYGTVSGGCLEADVMERAKQVLESGKPQIFTYDTTTNDDSVFSFNMGCRGVVKILLEPIGDKNHYEQKEHTDFLRKCFEEEKGVSSVFISPDDQLGRRVFFHNDQDGYIGEQVKDDYLETLESEISRIGTLGNFELFYECISPPIKINIFGAGADAVPLAKLAKELGWHTTVIDHRTALANNERFDNPDEIVISRPEEVGEKVSLADDSVAVVMTHNYDHDKTILESLFEADLKYIGLLGPKVRTKNILRELGEKGIEITDENLEILHAPVGLDTGAHLPETIALSILTEIQTVLANRQGGFLKNRKKSIYGRD